MVSKVIINLYNLYMRAGFSPTGIFGAQTLRHRHLAPSPLKVNFGATSGLFLPFKYDFLRVFPWGFVFTYYFFFLWIYFLRAHLALIAHARALSIPFGPGQPATKKIKWN